MTVHERKSFYKEQGRIYTIDMSLIKLSECIAELIEQHGPDAMIEHTMMQYDDGYYYSISVPVPETDAEMQTRINAEVRRAKATEESEKRQLAMLLAKHGVPDAK